MPTKLRACAEAGGCPRLDVSTSQGPGVPAASCSGGGPAEGGFAGGAKVGARGSPPSRMPTCSGLM
eukprot:4804109-Alexandrium_andersonii.AAC.1